jgi:hypothetical protein
VTNRTASEELMAAVEGSFSSGIENENTRSSPNGGSYGAITEQQDSSNNNQAASVNVSLGNNDSGLAHSMNGHSSSANS